MSTRQALQTADLIEAQRTAREHDASRYGLTHCPVCGDLAPCGTYLGADRLAEILERLAGQP